MGDWGIRVSQKGENVLTCPDNKLVFSSSFQTLKIHNTYSRTTTRPAAGTNKITITHSLGYYAPYIVVYNGSTTRGTGTSYFFNDGQYTFVTQMKTNTLDILVDSFFDFSGTNDGDTVYFTVYIFLDDFRTISESNIITGTSTPGSIGDYGLRVSKDGYDVKTCTDDQLAFSSSFFNQLVHKKGTVTGVAATVSHNLGYYANFLLYYQPSGQTYITYDAIVGQISTTQLVTTLASGDTGYYIIFKNKVI